MLQKLHLASYCDCAQYCCAQDWSKDFIGGCSFRLDSVLLYILSQILHTALVLSKYELLKWIIKKLFVN